MMEDSSLEIDFNLISVNDSASQEEKEAKFLKILLTFEHGLKGLIKRKAFNKQGTSGPEAQLLLLLSLPTWNPTPLTLNAFCRCIKLLYSITNLTATQTFVDKMLDWMNAKEAISQQKKTAVLDCISTVVEVQGNKLYNYLHTICSLCLKLIKNTNELTNTRYAALSLLKTTIKCSNSMDEVMLKDVLKTCKSLLNNKAASFIVISIEIIEVTLLYCKNIPVLYLNEELPTLIKVYENANFSIRRALNSLISTMVAGSQAANQKIMISKPKKKLGVTSASSRNKTTENDKDDINSIPTISKMLNSLSALHCKPNTLEEVRSGIFGCYITLFTKLGTSFVEGNYNEILKHIILDLNPGPSYAPESPFDALVVRQRSNTLLREIGQKILSEQGQVHAAKSIIELINAWIKLSNDQELKGQSASKSAIITAIDELSCLVQDLGDAAYAIQDSVIELLIALLEGQSYSIQVSASWCLRNVCIALPSFLPKLVFRFTEYLKINFIDVMPVKKSNLKKSMGYGYALGALISVSATAPQSVMGKLQTSIFTIASQLLKSEASMSFTTADINIFQSQNAKIQVGWVLLGSLMCLGPNYVRLVIPQIIMLFKAYLAKSSIKLSFFDTSTQMLALSITHAREHALQALYLFMVYNGDELAQEDVAQRLLPLLNNSLLFYKDTTAFISELTDKEREEHLTNIRKLSESVNMIRKRALQSYSLINPITYETSFSSLSKTVIELLTVTSKTQNATSSWTDEDVVADWTGWAGSGYAMTSHFHRRNIAIDRWRADRQAYQDESNHLFESLAHVDQFDLDKQLLYPRFGAREFDPISLYMSHKYLGKRPNYFHSMTSTVISTHDAAVDLFSILFPQLIPRFQTSILERMVHSIKGKTDLWGLYTISHCLFAILGALKTMYHLDKKGIKKDFKPLSPKTINQIEEIIKIGLETSDDHIRGLAAQVLGFLCKQSELSFVYKNINLLVDRIINFADPDLRAGSLLGLSAIHKFVGSATGSQHLSSVIQVMRTLCNDSHPLVHTHALEALATTINSIGHAFAPYIVDTLYIVFRLFLSDSHQPGGTAYSKSMAIDSFLICQNSGKVLNGIIGVLGPEIATNRASQFLCYGIMEQLKHDREEMVVIEYLRCVHLVIMFDYAHIDLEFLVPFLCSKLESVDPQLKRVAANCLYQLVQKSLQDVLKFAGPNLFEQLFQLLDSESELGEIVVVLNMLLSHSSMDEIPKWIDVIKVILTKHNIENVGSFTRTGQEGGDLDEEEGSLNQKSPSQSYDQSNQSSRHQGTSRWRTQLVALQILRKVLNMPRTNTTSSTTNSLTPHPHLIARFGDLIKLAFAAATTPIEKISLEGYAILQTLLEQFRETYDPQVEGCLLLEQYQAQVAAALAPALNGEFSPKVTSSAIEVCATFLATGAGNTKTINRIAKLMEKALNHSIQAKVVESSEDASFSSYESIAVSLAVLKGWSIIALTNMGDTELTRVLENNLEVLFYHWLKALNDYAYMLLDPKLVSMTDSPNPNSRDMRLTTGLDHVNHAMSRTWLIPIYKNSWLFFLKVIVYYLQQDHPGIQRLIFNEAADTSSAHRKPFWVIFGLVMEALSSFAITSQPESTDTLETLLRAISALFDPRITGPYPLDKQVFHEMLIVFERFQYTSNQIILQALVQNLQTIVKNYDGSYFFEVNQNETEINEKKYEHLELSETNGFRILKFYCGLLLGFLPEILHSKEMVNSVVTKSIDLVDLELILTICKAIKELILKAPELAISNLSIIGINLLKNIIILPYIEPIAEQIISLFEELIVKVDSKDVINSILNHLSTIYWKRLIDGFPWTLLCFIKILIKLPNFINEKRIQTLNHLLKQSLISSNSKIIIISLKCIYYLIENMNNDNSKIMELCKYCIKRSIPVFLIHFEKGISNELINNELQIQYLSELFTILLELFKKVPEDEKPSITKTILILFITQTKYPLMIPIICNKLTNFASAFPEAFKLGVNQLSPELKVTLQSALQSKMINETSNFNQFSSVNNNNNNNNYDDDEFNEFDNEEDYEDEFGEFDDDDNDNDNDEFGNFDDEDGFDDAANFGSTITPTIQLKDSFNFN